MEGNFRKSFGIIFVPVWLLGFFLIMTVILFSHIDSLTEKVEQFGIWPLVGAGLAVGLPLLGSAIGIILFLLSKPPMNTQSSMALAILIEPVILGAIVSFLILVM
jgi:hypothetical protein